MTPEQRGEEPVRVVVDLRWMRPRTAGGIENLSRAFLDHLLRMDRVNRYAVLVPSEVRRDFDLGGHPNVTLVSGDGPGARVRAAALGAARFLRGRLGGRRPPALERAILRRALGFPAEVALSIPGFVHPDLERLPNVLIVPDIQHEYFPEFFRPRDLEERRRRYAGSARGAAHICAISDFTRRTLIERFGIPPERITTTYLAADPIFHPGSAARGRCRGVLDKYRLGAGQYVLYPANTWPHKNHAVAVQALRALRDASGLDPLLVCTGAAQAAHGDFLEAVRSASVGDRVRWLGYCPAGDMPALYEGAAAMVFPSLFEGFGLPLLEAMWCDCPIVCSSATSLPEIARDAAVLVDPRRPDDVAHGLGRVLTDRALRRTLVERGRRRAAEFSWARFTGEVVSVLRRVRRASAPASEPARWGPA